MTETQRIIKEWIGINATRIANNVEDCSELAKAIEQYVLSARIRQLEYVKEQQLIGGFDIDEDIAQLKKGLTKPTL